MSPDLKLFWLVSDSSYDSSDISGGVGSGNG